jgi:uncharacterized protein YjiS (DUF1127 family)
MLQCNKDFQHQAFRRFSMIDVEKSAAAHLPAAEVWLRRGERLAGALWGGTQASARALGGLLAYLQDARARRAALRELYRLDDRLLKDIGLRRDQIAEFVDSMFRGGRTESATARILTRVVAGPEDITEVNVGNDGHYRSAA